MIDKYKDGEYLKKQWVKNPFYPYEKKPEDFIDPNGNIVRSHMFETVLMAESGFTQRERCHAMILLQERQRDFGKDEKLPSCVDLRHGDAVPFVKW
jgi:hypothetical protein